MTTEYVSLALLSLLCTYFSKKETTIPTSILHSLSTFLSRRYNLNSTPSNRDRESLARDVAYSLKHIPAATTTASQSHQQQMVDNATASIEDGNDQLETTLEELEQTLTTCELSLDEFERKERFLYVRIEKYREMIRERECFIDSQEREQEIKGAASNDDNSVNASGEEETAGAVEEGEEATQDEEENNDNKNNNNNNKETNWRKPMMKKIVDHVTVLAKRTNAVIPAMMSRGLIDANLGTSPTFPKLLNAHTCYVRVMRRGRDATYMGKLH
mmetsp:Transcript_12215/g.15612  ORF Transcript_12215/g.15612 Transcript_12215/m.15612 type:complete len:272 (+) Transcript_12215:445-1260(+)